jgi:tRNA A37 threonylcarbamoyladenosine biosynthesis protein TsaE
MEIQNFEEDVFSLEEFAKNLESYIKVDHRFVSGSLVVSLNARFGAGKSTFSTCGWIVY